MLFPAEQYDQLKEAVKQIPNEANGTSALSDIPSPPIEQGKKKGASKRNGMT
jgi:hypothetical protein